MARFASGAGLLAALAAEPDGVVTEFDHDGDQVTWRTSQDCDPILDRNRELANFTDGYTTTPGRIRRHIAEIPNVVVEQWLHEKCSCSKVPGEHGFNVFRCSDDALRKRLRDPEYAFLRCSSGRI